MGSKTLTEEEKRIAAIFIHVCGKKGISTVLINKQYRYSIGKVIGKWAIISYYQDQPYNYEKYDDLYSACIAYFNMLDPNSAEYCKNMFEELVKDSSQSFNFDNYVKYEDLIDGEKIILDACLKVLQETGDLNRHIVYPRCEDEIDKYEARLYFYKKGNVWVVYILERNEKGGYREYSTLYPLCFEIFDNLEKSHTDYCLSRFPNLVKEALKKTNKKIKK